MNAHRPTLRRDAVIVGVACLGVLVYVLAAAQAGGVGFPLDDSWIHQVYGRNLATTGQWAFVPGVPSAASTSPLYTVLLSIGYLLHVPFYVWTYGLGAIGLAVAGLIAARLAEHLSPQTPHIGMIVGLITVSAWHFLWVAAAGMETIIFCALTLTLMWRLWTYPTEVQSNLYTLRSGVFFGVFGALTTLARPEGAGLFALCLGLMLLTRPQGSWRGVLLWLGTALIGWIVCLLPYLILNIQLTGTVLPNTSAAKQAENAPLLDHPFLQRLLSMIYPLIAGGQLILIPGLLFMLVMLIQRTRRDFQMLRLWAAPLWIVGLVVLYAWRLPAPYQHGRYVIPALAPYFVLAGVGTVTLVNRRYRPGIRRALLRAFALTALIGFPIFWLLGAGIYAGEVRLIEGEMVTAAKWIAQNLPADQTLATHDIGALGYFAPRPLFDLAGLISPEVVPIITQPEAVFNLMQQRGIQYMMASPPQLPVLQIDKRLCVLFTTEGADTPAHMTVYRIAWDGNCGTN